MNVGAALVLLKLAMDSGFTVSPKTEPTTPTVGPPPNDVPSNFCYRTDGKLTWACYRKFIDPAASYNDYQDYLTEN